MQRQEQALSAHDTTTKVTGGVNATSTDTRVADNMVLSLLLPSKVPVQALRAKLSDSGGKCGARSLRCRATEGAVYSN